jgi:hypothetical protein
MRESPYPRIELEIAAVRAARRPVPDALEDVLRRVDEARALLGGGAAPTPSAPQQETLLAPRETGPPRAAPERPRPTAVPSTPTSSPRPTPQSAPSPPAIDEASAWARVIDEVKARKIMLGSLLDQTRQGPVADGELTIVLTGSRFQRDTLNERANRDLILQSVRKYMPGVERINVVGNEGGGGSGDVRSHPTVEAVIAEFDGEVVAVRPRADETAAQ